MRLLFTTMTLACGICLGQAQGEKQVRKLDTSELVSAPNVPQMVVDADGTLHFGPRTIPLPALASPEAKQLYTNLMLRRALASAEKVGLAAARMDGQSGVPAPANSKQTALKIYDVTEETQKIGGIGVTIYSPKLIPPKNHNKVVMEFQIDAEAIAVASLGQLKVIKVNYRGGGPSIPGNEDIVTVYRELLKTYKPQSIGMFGSSGGCTLTQTTVMWLPQLKLPLPGAVGLNTCSGGSNPGDARYTINGLDASLSSAFSGQAPHRPNPTPRKPTEPPATALDGDIPKGYPPAFLLSGTRDMCLSQTAMLHRKLRQADVETELHIFEGMWHVFWEYPDLPESREAMTELAGFFNRHLK